MAVDFEWKMLNLPSRIMLRTDYGPFNAITFYEHYRTRIEHYEPTFIFNFIMYFSIEHFTYNYYKHQFR